MASKKEWIELCQSKVTRELAYSLRTDNNTFWTSLATRLTQAVMAQHDFGTMGKNTQREIFAHVKSEAYVLLEEIQDEEDKR